MSERLTLQDLVDLLSNKQNITKKDAEAFLRELVALISETIEQKDFVRIKDFGTFKLTPVSARKSVDVNTGAAIEIPAHYKLSFIPDKLLREGVNRPFSHFESILLEDEVTFEDKTFEPREVKPIAKPKAEAKKEETVKTSPKPVEVPKVEAEPEVVAIEAPKVVEKVLTTPIDEPVIETNKVSETLQKLPVVETLEEVVTESDLQREEELADLSAFIAKETAEKNEESEKIVEKKPVVKSMHVASEEEAIPPTPRKVARKYDDDDDDDEFVDYEFIAQQRKKRNMWIGVGITIIVLCVFGIFGYNYYAGSQTDTIPYAQDNAKVTIADDKPAQQPVEPEEVLADNTQDNVAQQPEVTEPVEQQQPVVAPPVEKPTVTPPPASSKPTAGSKEIEVKSGQTMRALGQEYFGNSAFWVYIFEENRDRIKSPDAVYAGMKLIIPPASKYEIDANDKVSVKKAQRQELKLFGEFSRK